MTGSRSDLCARAGHTLDFDDPDRFADCSSPPACRRRSLARPL